jgi:tripartite-type tricarboxylate transporter receptor subunit TctC
MKGDLAMLFFKKNRARLAYLLPIMVLIAMVSAGVGAAAGAEKYPAKAVTIIVPFAPGGGVDLAARVVADSLTKEWAQPVNVVNKEGGNTVIGTLEMMKSKPDGYTVLADNPSSASFQVILPDLPYKIEDRTSLATATAGPLVFAVNSKAPWMDLKDVAAAAKKNPENFRWGSLGGVSVADFALQQFFADAGIDLPQTKTVRFKGAGDAIIALAGGHIDFTSVGVPAVLS